MDAVWVPRLGCGVWLQDEIVNEGIECVWKMSEQDACRRFERWILIEDVDSEWERRRGGVDGVYIGLDASKGGPSEVLSCCGKTWLTCEALAHISPPDSFATGHWAHCVELRLSCPCSSAVNDENSRTFDPSSSSLYTAEDISQQRVSRVGLFPVSAKIVIRRSSIESSFLALSESTGMDKWRCLCSQDSIHKSGEA